MSLNDLIETHNTELFMNHEHFAEWHTWNGVRIQTVVDEETALKRKNNNVNDISWDNNVSETLIYTPVKGFPGKPKINTMVVYDGKSMLVRQSQEDMGMYTIVLTSQEAKVL